MSVSGNWRVIRRFADGDVSDADYGDYHEEGSLVVIHNPAPPGQVRKALYLDPRGVTMTQAAKGLQMSRQALSHILHGPNRITPDMALRFEKTFGASRQAWRNMQQHYDWWHAAQEGDRSEVQIFVTSREEGL